MTSVATIEPAGNPKLRTYQQEAKALAIAGLHTWSGFALFMEQRTGKTPVACEIAYDLNPERILIIGPEIARQVWEKHIEAFNLIRHGRAFGHEIVFVTRDMVFKLRKKLARWLRKARSLVICDEGHDFKDWTSKRSRGLRYVGRRATWRLLLTGTPQESGLEDYWAQFDFVNEEIFGELADFKARYLRYGGFKNKKIIGYRNQNDFRKILRDHSYRILLEKAKPVKTDLAPPTQHVVVLTESADIYNEMHKKFIAQLNTWVMRKKLQPDGSIQFVRRRKFVAAPLVITQSIKLQQIASGFIQHADGSVHWTGNEKLEVAGTLMLTLGNVPQVWFVRYLPNLYRLGQLFEKLGRKITYISGQHKEYKSGDPFDIALVQQRSGVSIDLAHAEEAIFYTWTYSHLDHDQAKFRIRSYHGKRARYHYLVAKGTVDEELYKAVIDKLSFSKLVLDRYRNT